MADTTAPTSSIAPSRSLSRTRVSARRRSYSSYLRWSKSMRMSPQSTDTLLSIALGLGLRYIVDTVSSHSVKVTGSIVGLWEGVILLHFTKKTPKSSDPFVAFGARMFVDFVCTESFPRQVLVLLWMWLGMVLADVMPAIWSDKRVRRIRRRLAHKVRSLTNTVPTLVLSPPAHRTIRFVPSHDLHTILEESTQASAAPSVIIPLDESQPEEQAPSTPQPQPQPQPQRVTAIHAPLIAIFPVLQDAVAAISASQETPVIQLSDFLPPVSSPYEEPQVIYPTDRTPTAESYTNPVGHPRDNTLHVEYPHLGATGAEIEPTEPIKPSSVSIFEVPNIEDIEEIVADEAYVDDVLPAVIRRSGTSTPLYGSDRHSGALAGSLSPPHDYDYRYTHHSYVDPLRFTHTPEPDGVFNNERNRDHEYDEQHGARAIPIYDINDLAEIQNEPEDAADIFIPPSFSKSPSATPEVDAGNSYMPLTPPESTTFKRRKLDHHERLPEGYFPPPRPAPRRQESKALPPVPPPDDDNDTNSDDIYVNDDEDPTLTAAAEGWEKVDLADYAFVPPTRTGKGDDDSPSSYGVPQERTGSALFRQPSPDYSEGSFGQRYTMPQLTPSHSQESDQELKALVHDLGPLIQ
ncbi:hypothetical protein D9619_001324 [Psilocybe cf. subviscida]|uniref:Uncharacterized protein n=1 Tax=Psilocybe cf. subviscida TaxID=2480587 RepID=A0A8H5BFD0_9AGAR|nr:hypothetical protein D9619_001324 [Psilocybe cf. subviscida]